MTASRRTTSMAGTRTRSATTVYTLVCRPDPLSTHDLTFLQVVLQLMEQKNTTLRIEQRLAEENQPCLKVIRCRPSRGPQNRLQHTHRRWTAITPTTLAIATTVSVASISTVPHATSRHRIRVIEAAQAQSLAAWNRRLARQLARVHGLAIRMGKRTARHRWWTASSVAPCTGRVATYHISYFSLVSVHTSRWMLAKTTGSMTLRTEKERA